MKSLNHYNRFIKDLCHICLYPLQIKKIYLDTRRNHLKNEDNTLVKEEEDDKWARVQVAFDMLKYNIASAPILRHFDPAKEAIIIVYARKWAI